MTTSADYDGPVYVGPELDEPELVDADVDVDEGPVPAAGEREEADVMAIAASEAKRWQPLLDRLTDAPAVPVGVHPEPAEDETDLAWQSAQHWKRRYDELAGRYAPPAVPSPAAGEREEPVVPPVDWALAAYLGDNEDEGYPHPAPSVVQPEPGDRAVEDDGFDTRLVPQEAWDAAQAAVQARWPDMRPVDAALLSTYAVRTAAPLIVAAAVAAVRADRAEEFEALREMERRLNVLVEWVDGYDWHNILGRYSRSASRAQLHHVAAAVRSATKEES